MNKMELKKNKLTEKMSAIDNQLGNDDENVFPQRTGILWLVIGRKGSGKSTVVLNLLNTPVKQGGYKKFFNNIFLCNPSSKDPKYSKLIKELEKSGNYYEEMNENILQEIVDKIETFNDNYDGEGKPANLLILDDCLAYLPRSNQKAKVFHRMITGMRHLKLSVFITSQKLKGCNTIIRSNTDIASFWRNDAKSEVKDIVEEFGVNEDILNEAWKTKHSFATVSFTTGIPRYFIKFDEIQK